MKYIRKIGVKLLELMGKAVDIWSTSSYPANVLSNLYPNAFEIDGVRCASMEGFLQSLKTEDIEIQKEICALSGKEAKEQSTSDWQTTQMVHWQGKPILRQSPEYRTLLHKAYQCLFEQNETFRIALLSTKDKRIYHTRGLCDPRKTILTEQEFCTMLKELINDN